MGQRDKGAVQERLGTWLTARVVQKWEGPANKQRVQPCRVWESKEDDKGVVSPPTHTHPGPSPRGLGPFGKPSFRKVVRMKARLAYRGEGVVSVRMTGVCRIRCKALCGRTGTKNMEAARSAGRWTAALWLLSCVARLLCKFSPGAYMPR